MLPNYYYINISNFTKYCLFEIKRSTQNQHFNPGTVKPVWFWLYDPICMIDYFQENIVRLGFFINLNHYEGVIIVQDIGLMQWK